jgi:DNA-directed RNA polymerase subunit RPC12/RpoP
MEPMEEAAPSTEVLEEPPPPPCKECGKKVSWDEVLCPTCGSGLVAQRRPPSPPSRVPGLLYKLALGVGGAFIIGVLVRWVMQIAEIFE